MNYLCNPNRRQYTISYNKHDLRVYNIAFFARRLILKNKKLTFDYLNKEEGERIDKPGKRALSCLCRASLVLLPLAFKIEVIELRCRLH